MRCGQVSGTAPPSARTGAGGRAGRRVPSGRRARPRAHVVTYHDRTCARCEQTSGLAVDIAGIRGKLLISPAPGSPAGPAGSSDSGLCHGRGARSQPAPGPGVALERAGRACRALIGWTGGWAWKGPGHPVDNGDQARGQRDGLRSEGAARVLFLAAPRQRTFLAAPRQRTFRAARSAAAHRGEADTNPGVGSLFCRDTFSRRRGMGGTGRRESRLASESQDEGYHGLHCP